MGQQDSVCRGDWGVIQKWRKKQEYDRSCGAAVQNLTDIGCRRGSPEGLERCVAHSYCVGTGWAFGPGIGRGDGVGASESGTRRRSPKPDGYRLSAWNSGGFGALCRTQLLRGKGLGVRVRDVNVIGISVNLGLSGCENEFDGQSGDGFLARSGAGQRGGSRRLAFARTPVRTGGDPGISARSTVSGDRRLR